MTTIEDTKTEAAVVAQLAREGAEHEELIVGEVYALQDGTGGYRVVSTDEFAEAPRRAEASRVLTDAASFATYVNRHKTDATEVFAHTNTATVVAVIDSHRAGADLGLPGWQKHRVTLKLEHSKPWLEWAAADGKWFDQEEFAEFLENRYSEVIEPTPAQMIDIATSFEAKKGVDFKAGFRGDSGEVKLQYEETIKTKAGQKGELEIPKKIQLALRPYVGGPVYSIWANFRYRITANGLRLGFILERPENILDAAFADVVTDLRDGKPASEKDSRPGHEGIGSTPLFYGKPAL